MLTIECRDWSGPMPCEFSRRDFLQGAEALLLAAALNKIYPSGAAPDAVARDEDFWSEIRKAYVPDPQLLNLNNGGVAPAPAAVLDAEIEAIRYSNRLPAYRMWHDLSPLSKTFARELPSSGTPTPSASPSRAMPVNRFRSRSSAWIFSRAMKC